MEERVSEATTEIVIRPAVAEGVEHSMRHDRERPVEFYVIPPPTISGLDELWRVADAGWRWTHTAYLLRDVPAACRRTKGCDGVLSMLLIDIAACFDLLERALRTGEIPKTRDCRLEDADDVIEVAQQILEMDARRELAEHGDDCADDALALLASAREALAAAESAAEAAA